MKLYRVDFESRLYVAATNPREAEDIARHKAAAEVAQSGVGHVYPAKEIHYPEFVEDGWVNALPYGDNGGRTCAEIAREAVNANFGSAKS